MSSETNIIDTNFIFKHYPQLDKNKIAKAFDLCKNKERAIFMTDLIIKSHLGANTVLAAILIDVSKTKIKKDFGTEVLNLVNLTYKIIDLPIPRNLKKEYENELITMIVAYVEDLRALFLSLVYTLYLLEFDNFFSKTAVYNILNFAPPLAYRLNAWQLKVRLEDLCLQRLFPEKFIWIEKRLNRAKTQRENYINNCLNILKKEFQTLKIDVSLSGRAKHIYSIHEKLELKHLNFDEIYDIIAIRIVVNSIDECYQALGIVHALWLPKVERIKDYIAVPKPNNYQSIHTTVLTPENQYIEVQIRTKEMDREARFGIAAHWVYSKNKRSTIIKTEQSRWIKSLLNLQAENQNLELENMRITYYKNLIFIFTKKGELIRLPKKATPIDLAYAKSTIAGNHLSKVEINDKPADITTQLKSADVVKLILNKKKKCVEKKWLKFVVTEKAKNKIKEHFEILA